MGFPTHQNNTGTLAFIFHDLVSPQHTNALNYTVPHKYAKIKFID